MPVNGDWIVDKLHQVGKEIMEKQKAAIVNASTVRENTVSQLMHSFFIESDTDENGYLELPELKTALQKLQACANMSDSDLDLLCAYCDRNDDGRLNYLEFLAGFRIQHDHEMAEQVSEDLLESFFRVLYFVYRRFVVLALEQASESADATLAASIKALREAIRQTTMAGNEAVDSDLINRAKEKLDEAEVMCRRALTCRPRLSLHA